MSQTPGGCLVFKSTMSRAALTAALLTAPVCAHAETFDGAAVDELVVTASRNNLEEGQIGSAVTVKTAQDIEQQQTIFVKELLQTIPGVQITNDRPGGGTSVSIRGSSNDEVLFLIDGIELGDPSSTSTQYSTEHLVAYDIERMEVLRGNQSSLYGSDAIGGVVNIITRRATEDGIRVHAELEGGSYGTIGGGASILGKRGDLDFRVTATAYQHDGPSLAAPMYGPTPEEDSYERKGVSGRVGYRFSDNIEGQLIGFYTDASTDLDDTGADSDDTVDKDESGLSAQLEHKSDGGAWRNELTVGRYQVKRLYFGMWNLPKGDSFEGEKTSANLVTAYDGGGVWRVAAGLNAEQEETDQVTNFSGNLNAAIETKSAFIEVAARPLQNLTLTAAARLDDNSRFGQFDTYRLTGAYLFADALLGGDIKLRASWGTGAKAPGLYQLFDPSSGNPDLLPEESQGADIGVDLFWDRVSVEATLFQNHVEDEIAWAGTYVQIGETKSAGLELGLTAQVNAWLSLTQSYTYLDAQSEVTGLWLGRPRHAAFTSATVSPGERWSATLRARYRSDNESSYGGATDAYVIFDLLGSYRINETFEVYGRVVNLLDEDYQVSWGSQTQDRSAFVGVRASF